MFFNIMELLSRLELPNLFLTKEVLYRLSYSSALTVLYYYMGIEMSTFIPYTSRYLSIFFLVLSMAL